MCTCCWMGREQRGIIRRQSVKKFDKHFILLYNSIYISWSLAATDKEKNSWQYIFRQVWSASWSSGHLYSWHSCIWCYCLCWEKLSKDQHLKQVKVLRVPYRDWGDEAGLETKGGGLLCLFLDKWSGIIVFDSGPTFPGSCIRESQCFYAQRSKKFPSWGPLMLPLPTLKVSMSICPLLHIS